MYLTLSFTILPSILIVIFVIFEDKFREPVPSIIQAFFLGFLIIFPAGFLNNYFIFSNENSVSLTFIAGFTEEPIKFIALYLFLRKKTEFDEPMDAIVYATLLSLGFATLENFQYVYLSNNDIFSIFTAFQRAFTAIPLHACCGIIMGYYYGNYVFKGSNKFLLKSICFPIIIHSIYNYLCDSNAIILVIYIPVLIFYAIYLLDKMRDSQKQKNIEKEIKY
jgi:RsiW-degrading membrane proteinase PrsW (M82 family)